jgi:hypothetical protein
MNLSTNRISTMRGTFSELWRFAIVCRVETVLRPYLEALS